jgi:hypothetical protein
VVLSLLLNDLTTHLFNQETYLHFFRAFVKLTFITTIEEKRKFIMNLRGPFRFSALKERREGQSSYEEFEATELYCPKCGKAVPVIKSLLLVLPEGDKYEYRCRFCSTRVGDKIDRHGQYYSILKM